MAGGGGRRGGWPARVETVGDAGCRGRGRGRQRGTGLCAAATRGGWAAVRGTPREGMGATCGVQMCGGVAVVVWQRGGGCGGIGMGGGRVGV
jgi:hypothetical protein